MSAEYQVIARKWRPRTFDEVVGQEHVVRTLRNAITRNRIAHGYLFVGPRGTGKTTLARLVAKALNCTDGPKADFDPEDPPCRAIAEGSHIDVIEIDGASNNSVDNIRDINEQVRYRPAQGRFKVYIIDEVHMLSVGAFNALLKTLEEPPGHVKFLFATTDVQKVPATILSRVQRFDLRPIPDATIVERLRAITATEGIQAESGALEAIARLADGGMRDAQSTLDQLVSFCGSTITEADVLDIYGLVPVNELERLAAAVAAADHATLLELVDAFDASGRNLFRVLLDLESRVRSTLLDAVRSGGSSTLLGTSLTTEQLARLLDALHRGAESVRQGVCGRADFELALLRAVEESRARAIDTLLRTLGGIAQKLPEKKKP